MEDKEKKGAKDCCCEDDCCCDDTCLGEVKEGVKEAASFAAEKAGELKEKFVAAEPKTKKRIIAVVLGALAGLFILLKLRKKK